MKRANKIEYIISIDRCFFKYSYMGSETMYHYIKNKLLHQIRQQITPNRVSREAIIGSNVAIMLGSFVDNNCKIGSYTYIGYNCFLTKATIGRYVSIANNVSIGNGEHKLDNISTNSIFYDNPYETLVEKDITIGNDCWIGVDSIIRRGVTIGNGAVIGANSFVNKDVPDFAVVVGSPAKIIKYRFSNEQIALINASNWWSKDIGEAKIIIKELEEEILMVN